MELHSDFKDLFRLLNSNNIEYLIVGAYALAHHGVPRFTGDIDIYIHPSKENADGLIKVLHDFGFGDLGIKSEDFLTPEHVIQLGVAPMRIDFLTSIDGVSWETAWTGKAEGRYGDIPVNVIGKKELLLNKRATGRTKDLADIEALGEK
ncbi:MAG: hypothetical protein EHM28_04645 [Spirochaetaceae bacterium]|nr:MAG: hypothetical protein EHM28_04645 [Spirochaetaceae bacterium]